MAESSLWQRFQRNFLRDGDLRFSIDSSQSRFPEDFFDTMQGNIANALHPCEKSHFETTKGDHPVDDKFSRVQILLEVKFHA